MLDLRDNFLNASLDIGFCCEVMDDTVICVIVLKISKIESSSKGSYRYWPTDISVDKLTRSSGTYLRIVGRKASTLLLAFCASFAKAIFLIGYQL